MVDGSEMARTMARWAAQRISVGRDNRVALSHTLHRLSVKRDRNGDVDGLTCRVGAPMSVIRVKRIVVWIR